MEMADGTLRQKGCLAGEELRRVAWALATTLATLNRAGFIHGDLKPDNVLRADEELGERVAEAERR
eukprot:2167667-Amphidinium_carterae.1